MFVALYIFLGLTIAGNLLRLLNAGSDRSMSDGLRFFIVCWYVGCLMYAAILLTALAYR